MNSTLNVQLVYVWGLLIFSVGNSGICIVVDMIHSVDSVSEQHSKCPISVCLGSTDISVGNSGLCIVVDMIHSVDSVSEQHSKCPISVRLGSTDFFCRKLGTLHCSGHDSFSR